MLEGQFARAVGIAWHAQVVSESDISTELELMIALHLRPVIYKLVLVFILGERTITAGDIEAVAKGRENASRLACVIKKERS